AIYLAASVACAAGAARRVAWWLPAIIAAVALVWALTLAPRAFPNVRIPELFAAWEMKNERVEEGREMYGLLIVCVSMTALALATYRKRRRA
ncbi:MAG TPA: transmembrane 220 family protein, partial [Chthoniobacterales bacterium]